MGPIVLLCASLLLLFEARGTSAVTPVSVQTGHDLLLHVTEAVDLRKSDLLTWRFNNSKNIARYSDAVTIFTSYLGRAEYFAHNHSLLLRNVQQNDSGDYRAEVSGEDHKAVAEYKVTVQDPVSPVKLAVKHCSPDSSNLTVTCSTLDSLISSTFTCVNQTCSCERGEQSEFTTSAASLHVYLENGSVICNHSNQVSWKKDVKRIEDLCGKSAEFKHLHGNKDVTAIVVSTIILLVTIVAVILYLLYRRRRGKYKTENNDNTIYEVPKVTNANQPLDQIPTTSVPVSPTSTYCLVGPHTGTVGSSEARGNTQPESLYATVEKPAKS